MTKKIKSIEQFGNSGWEWELPNGTSYRTNSEGDGLWLYSKTGASIKTNGKWQPHKEFKQIEGTSQFSLPKDRSKAMRKIRNLFYSKEDY